MKRTVYFHNKSLWAITHVLYAEVWLLVGDIFQASTLYKRDRAVTASGYDRLRAFCLVEPLHNLYPTGTHYFESYRVFSIFVVILYNMYFLLS